MKVEYLKILKWNNKGGLKEMLIIALPLILSNGVHSIQHFIDRMYLSWYSPEAIAAALPASLLNFAIMCLFLGTSGYVSTFIAQYYGARQYDKIGPVLWQGIYIAAIGGVFHLLLIPAARSIFEFIGHSPEVIEYETIYFQIICIGAFPAIAATAMSGFFSGRGKPWPIFFVHFLAMATNLILDYLLIFGKFGFPEMGVKGAAIATVIAQVGSFIIIIVLTLQSKFRHKYNTLTGIRFNYRLFKRVITFGFPNGIQFFLDIMGISIFIFIIGRLGTADLAASNIALNINNLLFLPMVGIGITISVMVGQYLGADNPEIANRATWNGFFMSLFYLVPAGLSFIFFPDFYINMFTRNGDVCQYAETIRILLLIIAVYSIFDAFNISFSSALKGAGDIRYVMVQLLVFSTLFLILPTYLAIIKYEKNIYFGWAILSGYIFLLGVGFFLRFLTGKWRKMRVIEANIMKTIPDTSAPKN